MPPRISANKEGHAAETSPKKLAEEFPLPPTLLNA